jgi:hypothetical protein
MAMGSSGNPRVGHPMWLAPPRGALFSSIAFPAEACLDPRFRHALRCWGGRGVRFVDAENGGAVLAEAAREASMSSAVRGFPSDATDGIGAR